MIYQSTINELEEAELSLLFLIADKFLSPFQIPPKLQYVKMLRLDVVYRLLDILKPQAIEENKIVFDNLKNKLSSQ